MNLAMTLPDGLYDKIVTESLQQMLSDLGGESSRTLAQVPPGEIGERLADALAKQLTVLLDEIVGEGREKAQRQLALINALLVHSRKIAGSTGEPLDPFVDPPKLLHAIHSHA